MLAQAGKGLLDMHRSQLVHLDVKENNVLVHWDEDKGRYIGMVGRGRGGEGLRTGWSLGALAGNA